LIEWLVGGLGAIIFVGMLAVLIATGVNGADGPPSVRVTVERVQQIGGGYVVEFVARNAGEGTAAGVDIVGELTAGASVEERRAHFDYLPPHSARRGGVFFEGDPRQGELTLRAEGYNDP
jgi:uncharacterized protein (TIGR02588 family)